MSAYGSPSHHYPSDHQELTHSGAQRKRVGKACDRCRIKKSKVRWKPFSFFSFLFSHSSHSRTGGRGGLTPKEFSVMEIIPVTGVIPMIRFVHIPRGRGPGISFPREGKLFPTIDFYFFEEAGVDGNFQLCGYPGKQVPSSHPGLDRAGPPPEESASLLHSVRRWQAQREESESDFEGTWD